MAFEYVKMISISYFRTIRVIDGKALYKAQMVRKDKSKTLILSMVQLQKDLKHNEKMYLVTIKELQVDGVVTEVLVLDLQDFIEKMLVVLP